MITYTVHENEGEEYTIVSGNDTQVTFENKTHDDVTITNEASATVNITGNKIWIDPDAAAGVAHDYENDAPVLHLFRKVGSGDPEEVDGVTPVWNGDTYEFSGLPRFHNGTEYTYYVTEDTVEGYDAPVYRNAEGAGTDEGAPDGGSITNRISQDYVEIPVTKEWDDDNNRDGSRSGKITLYLYRKDTEIVTTETIDTIKTGNIQDHTFTRYNGEGTAKGYEKYDENGAEYIYIVREDPAMGQNYTQTYYDAAGVEAAGGAPSGGKIKNTYEPVTLDIEGTKTWNHGDTPEPAEEKATVALQRRAKGSSDTWEFVKEDKTGTEESSRAWTIEVEGSGASASYVFDDLPAYKEKASPDADTVELEYRAYELNVPESYVVNGGGEGDGYSLINTHTPNLIDINVTKEWDDNDNEDGVRPAEVTFRLFDEGNDTGKTVVLNESYATSEDTNKWVINNAFKDLPQFREGKEIVYTVKEDVTEELVKASYEKDESKGDKAGNYTITNKHISKLELDTDDADNPLVVKKVKAFPENAESHNFKFVLAAKDGDPHTPVPTNEVANVTVDEAGAEFAIDFGTITFTEPGTYRYTLVEQKEAGWKHNDATQGGVTVTVTVERNDETGKLTASYTKTTVENEYDPTEQSSIPTGTGSGQIALTKKLETNVIEMWAGMFRFEMKGLKATPGISDKDASGSYFTYNGDAETENAAPVMFPEVGFTEPGTYAFSIEEINDGIYGVTYDEYVRTAICTVTDNNADGVFEFDWKLKDGDSEEFINEFDVDPVKAPALPAVKELIVPDGLGRTLEEGEFKFVIHGGADTMIEGTNMAPDADDDDNPLTAPVKWDDLEFTIEDLVDEDGNFVTSRTFRFAIYESADLYDPNIMYDGNVYDRSLTLGWDENTGKLKAEWNDEDTMVFGNVYYPDGTSSSPTGDGALTITKVIDDADKQGREPKANEFLFKLTNTGAPEGVTVENKEALGTNDASGNVEFPNIWFDEAGEYTYTLAELEGYDETIAVWDTTARTVKATVTDNNDGTLSVAWSVEGEGVEDNKVTFTNTTKRTDANKVTVTKTFEVDGDGVIPVEVVEDFNIVVDYTEVKDGASASQTKTLEVKDGTVSADGKTYTWEIADVACGTNVHVHEQDYMYITGYDFDGTDVEVNVPGATTHDDDASFTMPDEEARVEFTNKYIEQIGWIRLFNLWEDDSNRDGKRPDDVTFTVTATYKDAATGNPVPAPVFNGQSEKPVTFNNEGDTAADTWTDETLGNLPLYYKGNEVTYKVDEAVVPTGYTKEIINPDGINLIPHEEEMLAIINKYEPVKGSVKVTKKWDDKNNEAGLRAEAKVYLYADGTLVGEINEGTVTTTDGDVITWPDLPVYTANGTDGNKKIRYTVKETAVPGYTTSYAPEEGVEIGDTETTIAVTNKHVPETGELTIKKHWDDNDDQDGFRADSITVTLYAKTIDGAEAKVFNGASDKDVTVSAADGWKYEFTGDTKLPATYDGKAVIYYVDGDTETFNGGDKNKYTHTFVERTGDTEITVTNVHKPEEGCVEVLKVWDDNNNQDGKRQDAVMTLKATTGTGDTAETITVGEKTISADINEPQEAVWHDLPVYRNGEKITYTVEEAEIDGYTTTYSDPDGVQLDEDNDTKTMTVTNAYTAKTAKLTVTKKWSDENNTDGMRADVTLHLTGSIGDTRFESLKFEDKTIPVDKAAADQAQANKNFNNDLAQLAVQKTQLEVKKANEDEAARKAAQEAEKKAREAAEKVADAKNERDAQNALNDANNAVASVTKSDNNNNNNNNNNNVAAQASMQQTSNTSAAPAAKYGSVVGYALSFQGVPYVWGGESPAGFDCSGLVKYVFAAFGKNFAHSVAAQKAACTPISESQLQPGDLVFWGTEHVGIYIGGGNFVHAPTTGDHVKVTSMNYYHPDSYGRVN